MRTTVKSLQVLGSTFGELSKVWKRDKISNDRAFFSPSPDVRLEKLYTGPFTSEAALEVYLFRAEEPWHCSKENVLCVAFAQQMRYVI